MTNLETILKEFDELIASLPKRVGETPKDIIKSFITSVYHTAYKEGVKGG